MVALVDELEQRGLVQRTRSRRDRRVHELHLTGAGESALEELSWLARAHEHELLAPLDADEQQLRLLLLELVDAAGLPADVHLGYCNR